MKIVKLKNGSEVQEPVVVTTMALILDLWNSGIAGICIVSDLVQICRRDPAYRKFGNNEEKLISLALLRGDGQPHDIVRNIVLSAFVGKGLDLKIVSPVAEN